MTPRLKAAATRAFNWLEANPDKHISGVLARTDKHWTTKPTAPNATCFCALGRIAKELGDPTIYDLDHFDSLFEEEGGPCTAQVYVNNDDLVSSGQKPKAIAYLRRLLSIES